MDNLASIEVIRKIIPHNNADKLEIAEVKGYKCIVLKDEFKVGDLAVFIQPDTVLPTTEWLTENNMPRPEWSKVFRDKSKRVKAIRLRGVWSYGIVMSTNILPETVQIRKGLEVSKILNITKYVNKISGSYEHSGIGLKYGLPKTDEIRYQNIEPEILELLYGKKVDVMLKRDGTSFSCGYNLKKDTYFITQRRYMVKPTSKLKVVGQKYGIDKILLKLLKFTKKYKYLRKCGLSKFISKLYSPFKFNKYAYISDTYNLAEKVENYCKQHNKSLVIRGEICGSGVQSSANNPHSIGELNLAVFSVYDLDERQYCSKGHRFYFRNVAKELDLPTVECLGEDVELTPELIAKYSDDKKFGYEGVVIQLNREDIPKDFDKTSFKVINLPYDESNKPKNKKGNVEQS